MQKDMLIIGAQIGNTIIIEYHLKKCLNQANIHPFVNSFCYFSGQFGSVIFEPNQFSSIHFHECFL